ncbi:GntR family transcriptional regulator [Aquirufa sp. TARAVU-A1A]
MVKTFISFSAKNADNKLPKYQQLINSLLRDIEMGELKPGERLPSINEASEECYLSRDTVERAYTELHKMGVITSIFRKGYFISDAKVKTKTKVLFLVGKITNTNKVVFDSFCESLGKNVMVDIYTYQYKTSQFQEIMSQQLGNYHYYVIMPHLIEEEEENIKCLKKISGDRLILLDQNFNSISHAHASIVTQPKEQLIALLENQLNLFNKYHSFNLVVSEEDYFDPALINGCSEFCETHGLDFQVLDGLETEDVRAGVIYFTLDDQDLVRAIKYAEANNLEIGQQVGLIAFNDSHFKEILVGGISVLSNQPIRMGEMAAQLINENDKGSHELALQFIPRKSL